MRSKLLILSSSSILVYLLLTFSAGVTSCTKTKTIIDTIKTTLTDTIIEIHIDTVKATDTVVTPALLTANAWKIKEMRALYGNSYIFYIRGGNINSQSFDNEYIRFNPDGTGLYTDNSGGQSTLNWHFIDTTYRTLVWNWNLPQPILITWENFYYKDGAIHYTEYYTQFGYNELESAIRIPK